MPIIRVDEISKYDGQEVTVQGWVYNRTDKGKLVFLLVRDGTGFVQCVAFKGDLDEKLFDQVMRLPQESAVVISGPVRADKRAPGIPGGYEIGVKKIDIVQTADADYPMSLKDHGVDFALDNRHLWIRMPSQWAILRVRSTVMAATREWLDTNGFIAMDTPILTPAAAEGTTTLFETEYFDEGKAYLAQTGQLYNEANIFAFGKVYCFGPTFRAEKSKTRRHLTEFWMLEPEIAFCDLDGLMEVEEQMITHIVQRVFEIENLNCFLWDAISLNSKISRHRFLEFLMTTPVRCWQNFEKKKPILKRRNFSNSIGALTSARRMKPPSQINSISRCSAMVIQLWSKRFIWSRGRDVPKSASRWICWRRRATEKSAAAPSASAITTYC